MSRRSQLPGPVPESAGRQAWEAALAEHFDRHYEAHPLPTVAELSVLEKYQGDATWQAVDAWLEHYGPPLIQEREILAKTLGVECDAQIIILSNRPGLLATSQILHNRRLSLYFLPPDSYESFLAAHPDETYRWHIVYRSCFSDELDPEVLRLARKKYKLRKSEQYWVHYEVSTLARLFERGCVHLWKWDGQGMTLLEEAFHSWIS